MPSLFWRAVSMTQWLQRTGVPDKPFTTAVTCCVTSTARVLIQLRLNSLEPLTILFNWRTAVLKRFKVNVGARKWISRDQMFGGVCSADVSQYCWLSLRAIKKCCWKFVNICGKAPLDLMSVAGEFIPDYTASHSKRYLPVWSCSHLPDQRFVF